MSQIVDRIRKLLSKTNEAGCTQAEAETAFAMASRLLAEHNLSMDDVSNVEIEREEYIEDIGSIAGRWTRELGLLYRVVSKYFFVEGFLSTKIIKGKPTRVLMFFGTPTNVETAKFIFN